MGRSFYYQKDADLYVSSNNFATLIAAGPTTYGLTAAQSTAYGALNTAWREAYTAAADPSTRTRGKVATRKEARRQLCAMAAELAKIVEATPTVTDEQKINLGLNVRATPSPKGPPGTPNKLKVELKAGGSLELKWKCENPHGTAGTMYQVWRRIGIEGELEYLGGTGEKRFIDATIPAGASTVAYQIQGVRSTAAGDFAEFVVTFGSGPSAPVASQVEASMLKAA